MEKFTFISRLFLVVTFSKINKIMTVSIGSWVIFIYDILLLNLSLWNICDAWCTNNALLEMILVDCLQCLMQLYLYLEFV